MKHLVLYYDKYKTIPQVKVLENTEETLKFIDAKTKAGIECYEYTFAAKYSVAQNVIRTQTL